MRKEADMPQEVMSSAAKVDFDVSSIAGDPREGLRSALPV